MGCAGSKAIERRESPLSEALERKLVHAIIATKRRKSFVVKKSSFNNLMLHMPKLVSGFKKIREAYAKASSPTGKITLGAFRAACGEHLGLKPDSESLKDVMTFPDVSDGVLLTHADLIVIFTVVYLLDGNSRTRTILSPEVCACLDLMEKSFMFFDSSADGCIERKELAMALKSGTRVFGRKASKSLADRLFDQLDWSKDGQITFKEYLVGMERIIIETGSDEDDDLEGDEEDEEGKGADGDWEDDGMKPAGGGPGRDTSKDGVRSSRQPSEQPFPPQQQQQQQPPPLKPPQQQQPSGVATKDEAAAGIAREYDEVRPFTNTGMSTS